MSVDRVTVVEEMVNKAMRASAPLMAAVGGRIYPAFSPAGVAGAHVTHDHAGPQQGIVAKPFGAPIAQVLVWWDVTAWTPGADRQSLRPIVDALGEALVGAGGEGRRHRLASHDGTAWEAEMEPIGQPVVPADVGPGSTWQRVSLRVRVTVRQL